jgi:transposase
MSALSIAPYFQFAGAKVVRQTVHATGSLIRLQPDRRYRPRCHVCLRPANTVHSAGHRRNLRDLSMTDRQVWLEVEYRKVWCRHCDGARVEQLSFCDVSQRITHRLARYLYGLCKVLTVEEVARHLDLDPKTVRAVDHHFLEEEFGRTDCSGLRILAIDEISLYKGQSGYMTVVLDYLTGRVVWMGRGRDMSTLDRFFAEMTQEQKAGIEAVALDMWEAYINRVKHHCPQAKIVFDLFHVVQAFGKVIDAVRRSEYQHADGVGKAVIKGSRYLLLRNEENLTEPQRDRLDELLELNHTLNQVYILKDDLKQIYTATGRRQAKRRMEAWCAMAEQIDHWQVKRFAGRLRCFEEGILNHCEYAIGTSRLEGTNNKIKLIKRRAYGYHDSDYFALKVKQAFPGKETTNFMG